MDVGRSGLEHPLLPLIAYRSAADVTPRDVEADSSPRSCFDRRANRNREHLNVLFEDVRAVKLRSSYQPLVLAQAGNPVRDEILSFADMPERYRRRHLSLTLSTEPEVGFVLCGRATVLAVGNTNDENPMRPWPDGARVLHTLRRDNQAS